MNYALQGLEQSKPVILTGDLNCAHEEIDIFNPAVSKLIPTCLISIVFLHFFYKVALIYWNLHPDLHVMAQGNKRSAGFTEEERKSFETNFLDRGFVDTFRKQHPNAVAYSYWGYRHGGRRTNKGMLVLTHNEAM